jgi:hypothetical protein
MYVYQVAKTDYQVQYGLFWCSYCFAVLIVLLDTGFSLLYVCHIKNIL